MFYNARWYDPYLNHFTQPDSIVPNPYNPQDYNRYSYVGYNPINYTDPTGHLKCRANPHQVEGDCSDKKTTLEILAEYGVYTSKLTLEENKMVLEAVQEIDAMLGNYGSSFIDAFGTNNNPVTLSQTGLINTDGYGAYTHPDGSQIDFFELTIFSVGLIIHELGHVFDFRLGRIPSSDWNTWNIEDDYTGWLIRPDGFRQTPDENRGLYTYYFSESTEAGEEFADMFVALTMNWWETNPRGGRTEAANSRFRYMNTGMPFWLRGQNSSGP